MSNTHPTYRLDVATAKHALDQYLSRFDGCGSSVKRRHKDSIETFLAFVGKGCPDTADPVRLTEPQLMEWMTREARTHCANGVAKAFTSVSEFLTTVTHVGVISENPMETIFGRYPRRGWLGIAEALRSPMSNKALEALRTSSPYQGHIGVLSKAYLTLKRSGGAQCQYLDGALIDFNRFLSRESISSPRNITSDVLCAWSQCATGGQNKRREKALTLKHFFDYLLALGAVKRNPVTNALLDSIGPHRYTFSPYIFSPEEISLLLCEAKRLPPSAGIHLIAETMYAAIALLYTLGLRVGELCRLRIEDVGFKQDALLIRNAKFYKDRLIPFGPRLRRVLLDYLEVRNRHFGSVEPSAPLFVGRMRSNITQCTVLKYFHELLSLTGVGRNVSAGRPRLHDLRHSFAVNRLLDWYREGVDVQSRLVHLSTFMGHIGVESTSIYLTITHDLLLEASKRFYSAFGTDIEKEVRT